MFLRKVSLAVGSYDSEPSPAIDLSEMHFKFLCKRGDVETPNSADIRIYNLSIDTINVIKAQYNRVVLQAGYEDNFGVIFDGNILQFRVGYDSAVDRYLDIVAADSDPAYNFATISTSVIAGTTPTQHLDTILGSCKQYGITKGYVTELPPTTQTRGKVMYGMARDEFRKIANTHGTSWSFDNNQLHMVSLTGYMEDEEVVLTSATGLIGFPEQTPNGLHVRCLINPRLKMGGLIKIDNAGVQQLRLPINLSSQAQNLLIPNLDADGRYRVFYVEYSGDTRGNDWYCDIVCLGINEAIPPGLIQKQGVYYRG